MSVLVVEALDSFGSEFRVSKGCGHNLSRVTVLLAAGISLDLSAAASRELRNNEFGFSVTVPSSVIPCDVATGGHSHGFGLLLDSMNQGCQSKAPQPAVGLYGDYNVLFDETPAQAMRLICQPGRARSRAMHSRALAFPGHPSAACEKQEDGGWVSVFVVAQAGHWPPGGDEKPGTPYINYTAQLHTTQERLTKDLGTFEQILAGVKITSARDLKALMRAAQPTAAPHVSS